MPDDIQTAPETRPDAAVMRGVIPHPRARRRRRRGGRLLCARLWRPRPRPHARRGEPRPPHALPARDQRRRTDDDRLRRPLGGAGEASGRLQPHAHRRRRRRLVEPRRRGRLRGAHALRAHVLGGPLGMLLDPFGIAWAIDEPAEFQAAVPFPQDLSAARAGNGCARLIVHAWTNRQLIDFEQKSSHTLTRSQLKPMLPSARPTATPAPSCGGAQGAPARPTGGSRSRRSRSRTDRSVSGHPS